MGPSGQLLDEALAGAGIPRNEVYVTNAVKHFKFEPRGTRRIHAKQAGRDRETGCAGYRLVMRSIAMMDILMLALGFGFFALAIGYTYACERL